MQGKWYPLVEEKHPLAGLNGQPLGRMTIQVLLGPLNPVGANYFQISLRDSRGRLSDQPALVGLYHRGSYPSHNWIEVIDLADLVLLDEEVLNLKEVALERVLWGYLADLIPPGGHLMVEYDSPRHKETKRSLAAGVPPVATPLGSLLFEIGCGVRIRDWDIAEGGNEGPRKLQGYKAFDEQHRRQRTQEMIHELRAFLNKEPSPGRGGIQQRARERAASVLRALLAEGGEQQTPLTGS